MRGFAKEDELELALIRIEIHGQQNTITQTATAWIASEGGHLISCAHPFWDYPPPEEVHVTGILPDGGRVDVEIVEVGKESKGMDYSILRIARNEIPDNARILKIWVGSRLSSHERCVIGGGFPSFTEDENIESMMMPWTGTTDPGLAKIREQHCFKIRCNDDGRAEGSSGGPVLLRRGTKLPVVMGIQVIAEANFVRFALPIGLLREQSTVFREILAMQDPWLKVKFLRSLSIPPALNAPNHKPQDPADHFCIALHSRKTFKQEHAASLQSKITLANERSKKALQEILHQDYRAKAVQTRLIPQPVYDGDEIEWRVYLHRDDYKSDGSSRLRSIVDLTGKNNGSVMDSDLGNHSHIVTVNFSNDHTKKTILGGQSDLRIQEPEVSNDTAMDAICALVHDIDLDSGFFHSIGLLPEYYATQEQRQLFSKEKSAFLSGVSEMNELYGIPTDFVSLPYVPFAGACRSSLNDSVDCAKVRELWLNFFWHLFRPGLGQTGKCPCNRVSNIEELRELICRNWPEMHGRISTTTLTTALGKCTSPLTSLRHFVLCVHSAGTEGRAAASMRRVFKKSRPPAPGQFTVIDGIDVLGLVGISAFVKILPFQFVTGTQAASKNHKKGPENETSEEHDESGR